MDEPLLSVIIPVFKVEQYLRRCVDSIINQTYRNLEILLIDDGSPDNCPAMCDEYAMLDSRICVIHKTNGGLSSARNAGLKVAKGEYICFIDSDDFIDLNTFEIALNSIINDKTDLVIFNFQYCDEFGVALNNKKSNTLAMNNIWSEEDFWYYFFSGAHVLCVVSWNKIYKRKLFDNVRFPEGRLHEDQFVIFQIISQCKAITYLDKTLYWYVQRSGSIMANRNLQNDIDYTLAYLEQFKYFYSTNRNVRAIEVFNKSIYNKRKLRNNIDQLDQRQLSDYNTICENLKTDYWKLLKSDIKIKTKLKTFIRYKLFSVFSMYRQFLNSSK